MKKFLIVVLAALMLVSMAACGGKKTPVSADPNAGLYTAATAEMFGFEMDVSSVFGKGFTIDLQANGKCALNVDGAKANGKWTLSGDVFHVEGGGVKCDGTLKNGTMVLEDVMGMGLGLTLLREGSSAAGTDGSDGDSTPADTDAGHYTIVTFEQVEEGVVHDIDTLREAELDGMFVLFNEDGTGTIRYDEDTEDDEITWANGKIVVPATDEVFEYSRTGDVLTVNFVENGVIVTYSRATETAAVAGTQDLPQTASTLDEAIGG